MNKAFRAALLLPLIAPFNLAWSLPGDLPSAVPFYRTPSSLFSSGQAPRAELETKLKSQEFRHTYRVSWNNKEYTVNASQLVREIDCAGFGLLEESAELLEKPESSAKSVTALSKDDEVEILKMELYWTQVRVPSKNKTGWLPQSKFRIKNEDAGVFVNIIDTYLRRRAAHESLMVTTIPKAQRLKILGFDNGFLKTQYRDYTGYVDLSHVVSKADFAVWAYHDQNQWLTVSHRENEFVVTKEKKKIPFDQFSAFTGNPAKAVILESEEDGPPVRSYVQILSSDADQWAMSELKGHGLVWWKKENPLQKSAPQEKAVYITTTELMQRPIFSLALEAGKKVKGLVSAQGVFKTEDGVHWQHLKQFGNNDLPVAVHPDGYWFVGSHKSKNRGATFDPFIRWDQLAEMIEAHLGRHARQIRLQKIESLPKGQMQVLVDTGPGHVKLRYHIDSSLWSVVK